MPESKVNKNLRVLKEGIIKNRRRIGALNTAFNERLQQQQQNINNLNNVIQGDNRQRDRNISEISHNLALLKLFITEKLSNHPADYRDFVNDQSRQPINNSIQGGKRKIRKRKNKKTRRKHKKSTKKKTRSKRRLKKRRRKTKK